MRALSLLEKLPIILESVVMNLYCGSGAARAVLPGSSIAIGLSFRGASFLLAIPDLRRSGALGILRVIADSALGTLGRCWLSRGREAAAKRPRGAAHHQGKKTRGLHFDSAKGRRVSLPRKIILSAGTTRSSMMGPTSMPPTMTVASGRWT